MNKDQIILMSKLAVYDKTYGERDKRANGLFYRDYVYRRNFSFRCGALIGSLILIAFHFLALIINEEMDFFAFDYIQFGINAGIILGIIMVIYTFIGTRIATEEYKNIKLRLKDYFSLIRQLDELKETEVQHDNEDENSNFNDNYRTPYLNRRGTSNSYREEIQNKYGRNLPTKRDDNQHN